MSTCFTSHEAKTHDASFMPAPRGLLQRKCACGVAAASMSGECEECGKKRLVVQRRVTNQSEKADTLPVVDDATRSSSQPLVGGTQASMEARSGHNLGRVSVRANLAPTIQAAPIVAQPEEQVEHDVEREAAREIQQLETMPPLSPPLPPPSPSLSRIAPFIQRQRASSTPPTESTIAAAPSSRSENANLIVEDSVTALGPGQMRKSQFLAQLQSIICATTDAILASVGRSTRGCPYLQYWFGYLAQRSSRYLETGIRRYAPETSGASAARDYIPLIAERVRQAVSTWATTGQVTGVPEGFSTSAQGTGAEDGTNASSASASNATAASGSATSGVALKERDGRAGAAGDPQTIQAALGPGRVLDSSAKSRMESVFGHDFSNVRVHTDSVAASMATQLNARAFTVGSNVAFAGGEYQPGSLIGDALLAHELAHVVQQRGTDDAASARKSVSEPENHALEEEADMSAVGAVVSLWSRAKGALSNLARQSLPLLKSGLRLSRCDNCIKTPIIMKRLGIYQLAGNSMNPRAEVSGADTIWRNGAGIGISGVYHPRVDVATTRRLIGTQTSVFSCGGQINETSQPPPPVTQLDLEVDTSGAQSTTETNNLESYAPLAGNDVNVFFVPNVIFGGLTNPRQRQIYISNRLCSDGFTLAHELGHIFLGPGHSRNWSSQLMIEPQNCPNPSIDAFECQLAREPNNMSLWQQYMNRHGGRMP